MLVMLKKALALLILMLVFVALFEPKAVFQNGGLALQLVAVSCWLIASLSFLLAAVANRRFLARSVLLAVVTLAVLSAASGTMRAVWLEEPAETALYLMLVFFLPVTMAHKWLWFEKIDTG